MNRRIAVPLAVLAVTAAACDRTPSEPSAAMPDAPAFTLGSGTDTFITGALSSYIIHNTPGAWYVSSGQLVADSSAKQSVVTRNGLTIANGYVQTETSQSPDGGLVLRFLDKDNYYLLAVRDDSRYGYANLQISKFLNGVVSDLSDQYDVEWPADSVRTVKFEASGTTLKGYVNGELIVQVTDPSFASGGAGLRSHSASGQNLTSRFNELVWGGTTTEYYTDNFYNNTIASYTRYNTTGTWSSSSGKLVADSSAKQALIIRNHLSFSDGWVETVTSQTPDGGLVLRMQDSANYYFLAIRDDTRYGHANIHIYDVVAGIATEISPQLDITWSANAQKTVRFEASGTTLSVYVDGVLVEQVTDSSFSTGRAGLRANSASGENLTSRFELFRWYY